MKKCGLNCEPCRGGEVESWGRWHAKSISRADCARFIPHTSGLNTLARSSARQHGREGCLLQLPHELWLGNFLLTTFYRHPEQARPPPSLRQRPEPVNHTKFALMPVCITCRCHLLDASYIFETPGSGHWYSSSKRYLWRGQHIAISIRRGGRPALESGHLISTSCRTLCTELQAFYCDAHGTCDL